MNTCEYLARVGFDALLDVATPPRYEDDAASVEESRLADHAIVRDILLSAPPVAVAGNNGVRWIRAITWPDRVPGLKTWAGQQRLDKIIKGRQEDIRAGDCADLFEFGAARKGTSGIDALSCQNAIDIGFSPARLGMAIMQRPALELLAIIGLETLPIISYEYRVCGFVHNGRLWRFRIEDRDGGYLHRWGDLSEHRAEELSCRDS